MTSATYRQSSHPRPELVERDPKNILIARQNRFRVEAEILRDLYLASSGLLTPAIGGPSVRPKQPAGISELTYAGAAKWVEFLTRRPDLTVEAFQRHWREVHGPIAARIPQIRRYVQSHVRPGAYASGRTPRYDGVAITWFDDTQAMRASAATAEYATTRADEANFLASGDAPVIITREHVIVK